MKTKSAGLYKHPYGGLAEDKFVTRRQFSKIFNFSDYQLKALPTDMKVADIMVGTDEICGYVIRGPRGGRHFMLTVIKH